MILFKISLGIFSSSGMGSPLSKNENPIDSNNMIESIKTDETEQTEEPISVLSEDNEMKSDETKLVLSPDDDDDDEEIVEINEIIEFQTVNGTVTNTNNIQSINVQTKTIDETKYYDFELSPNEQQQQQQQHWSISICATECYPNACC